MKQTLLIRCSDKRLGAKFRAATEEKFGHTYDISVPGPDACAVGDEEHKQALMFFVQRFCNLVAFEKIILIVHEDCAGCQCDIVTHERNVLDMMATVASVDDFDGTVESYIARRPAEDDFAAWQIDDVTSDSVAVAAE